MKKMILTLQESYDEHDESSHWTVFSRDNMMFPHVGKELSKGEVEAFVSSVSVEVRFVGVPYRDAKI